MNAPPADAETLAACLTPPGTGAIATLAVRGPAAWTVVRGLFRPYAAASSPLPGVPETGRIWLGRLGDAEPGSAADEVVLTVPRVGPCPWLEINCHGGREVVRWLLEVLAGRGITACSWQELERRTADNPGRATAMATLVQAPTVRTAGILLDQYHGAFARAVAAARDACLRGDQPRAHALLDDLARYSGLGRHLTSPWRVAILGAPNVGKSSLMNALAGYQRSVVAATPGTTRDVVTTLTAVEGWPVELSDTAGLREQAELLEEQGIERARAAAEGADVCLWVLDAAAPPVWPAFTSATVRLLINKVDLPPAWDLDQAAEAVRVSARTGDGVAELCRSLARWLVPDAPPPGAAVPFTPELCLAVEKARERSRAGRPDEAARVLELTAINPAGSGQGERVD